ncbi:hypothetical protein H920_09768 [Fukomys damarensis]|uniref:Uncharacterized protein n=1 Tax=Fukomys damarensis TaxID=885580 RepID=A0A091E187_FUKDA|nr:hypothetical protein H920_09768 [Fukomys damarensis]
MSGAFQPNSSAGAETPGPTASWASNSTSYINISGLRLETEGLGPPHPATRPCQLSLHVCGDRQPGRLFRTPDALLPRDFSGMDFSCHCGLTLEPGRRVL